MSDAFGPIYKEGRERERERVPATAYLQCLRLYALVSLFFSMIWTARKRNQVKKGRRAHNSSPSTREVQHIMKF